MRMHRIFQSTPPVKAATEGKEAVRKMPIISIHAAREGGDMPARYAPVSSSGFQSTPPVKAATILAVLNETSVDISIHAAREGGDTVDGSTKEYTMISIHAAREGGDNNTDEYINHVIVFQSTPPVKAATEAGVQLFVSLIISIHAAREGGDLLFRLQTHAAKEFQSTPPVKAATIYCFFV